ncbi:38389_t:CDS:2, partial [Gigaspora margarita]
KKMAYPMTNSDSTADYNTSNDGYDAFDDAADDDSSDSQYLQIQALLSF